VVELGGGTGRNLLFLGHALERLRRVTVVDLCPAMLEQARQRAAQWDNVDVVEADATSWRPPEAVDCVYFSYSLTMIPAWRAAIDNALAMLRPGGRIGVVDFYVSAQRPDRGLEHHHAMTRWFWRRWFGHDGVRLDPEHLSYLRARVPDHCLTEHLGPVPYLPLLRVPHYIFTGTKSV
jgi:S-adenosylmethionine-diacylgycerolhomoserine-N-methlytransferase